MDKSWLMNGVLLFTVLCILWNLGAALKALLFDRSSSDQMLKALLRRVMLSVLLFAALLGAVAMGVVEVHTPFNHHQK